MEMACYLMIIMCIFQQLCKSQQVRLNLYFCVVSTFMRNCYIITLVYNGIFMPKERRGKKNQTLLNDNQNQPLLTFCPLQNIKILIKKYKTYTVFISSFSINLLAFYHKCKYCALVNYHAIEISSSI